MAPTSPTGAVVAAEGLKKRYGRGRWVLGGVDLRVAPGAITAVTGGNGSGKTTLLRVLSGVSRPSDGRVVGAPAPVGFVPDRFPTRGRLSARQYVAHMAHIRGVDPATSRTHSELLFEQLALTPSPDAAIRSLSAGNRQKVALVQALLSPVALLALDEPFAALDEAAHDAVQRLLTDSRDLGAAILFSAPRDVETPLADRIVELRGGRLTDIPSPRPSPPSGGAPVTLVLVAPRVVRPAGRGQGRRSRRIPRHDQRPTRHAARRPVGRRPDSDPSPRRGMVRAPGLTRRHSVATRRADRARPRPVQRG